jgi:hypothetical protein
MTTKKRNPQDATLRNVRAAQKMIRALIQRVRALERRHVRFEDAVIAKLYEKRKN